MQPQQDLILKKKNDHVSYSEVSVADECKFRHYLIYVEDHERSENIHTFFGNAVHEALDRWFKGYTNNSWISMCKKIYTWIKENPTHSYKNKEGQWIEEDLDPKEWSRQALRIYNGFFKWLLKKFPNSVLIGSEIRFKENIEEVPGYKFKGFIDLLLLDEKGKYHVIDFKTCSWGWNKWKKSDKRKHYQISLYKKFVCQKLDIDPKLVETHFILLKRTPSENSEPWEILRITSGSRKLDNATSWMVKTTKGIKRGLRIKNRTSCKFCPFHHTPQCP